MSGHLPAGANLAFHLALIAASLAASLIKSARYRAVNVVVAGAAVGVYVAVLFMRLQ